MEKGCRDEDPHQQQKQSQIFAEALIDGRKTVNRTVDETMTDNMPRCSSRFPKERVY